jgi:protein-S-isoprenylcysteine O-methyltransferase Ste14
VQDCTAQNLCYVDLAQNLDAALLPQTSTSCDKRLRPTKLQTTTAVNVIKSVLHNLGVAIVGFGFAFIGREIDSLLAIPQFHSILLTVGGWLLVTLGFLTRVWATYLFYQRRMKVILLVPQKQLITSGPYRFSRNPLYIGGNLFVFLGAVLILGSPSGILLTAINLVAVDLMIRREEKQLQREFGEEWTQYTHKVRRWL